MAEASSYLAVIAIDFGTSSCGYAFSLAADPKDIRIFNPCTGSVKTPTVVLTDSATKFVALGYDAVDQYSAMSEEEVKSHRLFQGFKMVLHYEKDLSYHTLIEDSRGQPCPAIDIFTMVLKHLADRALKQIRKEIECELEEVKEEIRWVITVPAIWSDAAKHFMKEAASRSGIVESTGTRNLFLALEPEAASLCCHSEFVKSTGGTICKMEVGDQYLGLDCGGGTLDTTAHEVRGHNDIAEICIANGGPIGAARVNDNFVTLLDKIFGKLLMDEYKRVNNQEFITLMSAFEAKKKTFDGSSTRFSLSFSSGIVDVYQEQLQKGIGKTLKELHDEIVTSEYKQRGVKIYNGLLQIPSSVLMEIFTPVVNDIIGHTTKLLKKLELNEVNRILMVGGFSDCSILQKAVRDAFGEYSLLIPGDAWAAVLKGAVMYGHNPSAISVRIARKTYGTNSRHPFHETVHDPTKKVVIDGKNYCDLFHVFVKQDDEVTNDMKIQKTFVPSNATQQSAVIGIYTALSRTPMYIDEPGVEKIGSITVKLPGSGLDRRVEVVMYFGGTAIEVEARDLREGGDMVATKVDLFTR